MITVDDLKKVEVLEALDPAGLEWLAEHLEEMRLETGDKLFEVGAPAEWLFITLEGSIQGTLRKDGRDAAVFVFEAGDVGGMLPNSRMTVFAGATRAVETSRVARLHIDHFPEMLERLPKLEARLAHLMADRIREGARAELQQVKLASLGTMSAGLAHELNNPASAARRAAQNLCDTLQAFDQDASRLLRQLVFREVPIGAAAETAEDPFQPIYDILAAPPPELDAMGRSEHEDELADWLEEEGVEAPWEAAAILVSAGFTREMLAEFSEGLVPKHRRDFLRWLPRDVEMRQLAEELSESTRRISELVRAMKGYTYRDQGEEQQEVDVHRGLEDTLTILQHKLRQRSLEVVRDFGDLPPVCAYGGELNQVWTNLLDNAIAAVPESGGRIEIRTCYEEDSDTAQVEVTDNGDGIPEEHLGRIFEPFFTTKEVGEGTGLGLDIVHRIVRNRHQGTIDVRSEPGKTTFCVRLPGGRQ